MESRTFRPGSHVLKVSAQDGYGNRSQRLLRLDLGSDSSVQALAVHNAPNPVKGSGTAFYFSALLPTREVEETEGGGTQMDRAEFEVRIFDQTGRLVRVLPKARSGIRWEGRDQWGNRLANGVYHYAVTARWRQTDGEPKPGFRTVATRRNTLVISR